ncbi:hypothetical protein QBC35DRAFT_126639 [Podospora australis]|uniref:C3H1-type domain-containing protein n=1 Tax=Podospora australis TaxID=1536484 RepID=A0AAN6WWU3_9PEZI|nr:hypothetical protein QBC35DRAFT_126639 [Podospora australis]
MTYNYGPPPPPPPAPPSGSPAGYPSYGPPRGGHSGRGRGGSDRGGYHQPPAPYAYGQQPPQYGPQNPTPYSGGPHPPQSGYSQPPQQQWHPEHGQQHPPPTSQHAPLPAQNYHPNYAPQLYQQPAPYNGQPPYPHAPPQPYGQGYSAPAPQPPAQQWGSHTSPSSSGSYGGGGRGGRGNYNDRGGPKSQMMGPPIRIGFDNPPTVNPPAPVSAPYQPQPYGAPQGPPAPYPAPYPVYPPPAPYMPAPAPYDSRSGHNPRHHNRGGFHNNSASRPHFGGDRNRHRNQNKGPSAQTPPVQHQKPDAASAGKKKKRKTNTLGLTPGDESEEDIENEEERLNEMYGAEAPNPKTSADIAAWIAERRANFPTKAKIEAKKASTKTQNGDSNKEKDSKEKDKDKERALEQRAEKLRKQLKKVESSIKRKREQQDEGDDMRELHLSSSPSSDAKSDDEKPEVMSTRQETSSAGLPPPPKRADPTKHCKYYSTGGTCGKRGKCRFVHDAAVREAALKERELNGGRMTLQQRLTLNDKEQEDLTIVETLKYLQDKGVVGHRPPKTAASNAQTDSNPAPETQLPTLPKKQPSNGLPPIPPPSVVSSGQTAKYSGWNLSGFGNTGVRSNED